jgi:hypothetical protein
LLRGSEVGVEGGRERERGGGGWTVVNLIPLVFVAGYMVEIRLCFEYVWKDLDFGILIVRETVRRIKDVNYRTTKRRLSNEPSPSEPPV